MANEHFVPQFYLRNFEINDATTSIPVKHIYSYKKGFSPIHKAIKSVASQINFDTNSDDENTTDFEMYNKLLKVTEDSSPPIISKIIESSTFILSNEEKLKLAWFIAVLAVRTPTAHRFLSQNILNHCKNLQLYIRENIAFDKQEIHQMLRLERPDITHEEVEEIINFFLKGEYFCRLKENDNNKAYIRGYGAANLDFVVDNLMSKNWHLLTTKDQSFFVTSDNPVSFLFPTMRMKNLNYWSCSVFLPLSPRKALYIHHHRFKGSVILLDKSETDSFVQETMIRAKDSLYSNTKSNELQNVFDSTKFDLRNLNYKHVFIPYFELKAFHKLSMKHFAETRND